MIGKLVVSFPPGRGGLPAERVAEIVGALDEAKLTQGGVGYQGTGTFDDRIRSGRVQWIRRGEIPDAVFSHLYTLATVANRERGWNFELMGIGPALQATSYEGGGQEHYDWHIDWGGGRSRFRKITVVAHLSQPTDFEGGSLQVTNGSFPVEAMQQSGTVTVFPSFLLHRVTPVTAGRRLAAVAWIVGEPYR